MTIQDLVYKVQRAEQDRRDGYMSDDEFVEHLACLFDGDVAYALGGTPLAHLPKLVVCLRMFPAKVTP